MSIGLPPQSITCATPSSVQLPLPPLPPPPPLPKNNSAPSPFSTVNNVNTVNHTGINNNDNTTAINNNNNNNDNNNTVINNNINNVMIQIRHRQAAVSCRIEYPSTLAPHTRRELDGVGHVRQAQARTSDGVVDDTPMHHDEARFVLSSPIRGVVPGQIVAVYDETNQQCFGSATICETSI